MSSVAGAPITMPRASPPTQAGQTWRKSCANSRDDAAVAAVVAQSAATESPVLVARGRYFMSGTSFDAFTEAFGTAMRDRRNAGLIARTFAAFRAGFTSVRETLTGGRPTPPPADALRTLGSRLGAEPHLRPTDAAILATENGDASAAAHQTLQADVDALITAMESRER